MMIMATMKIRLHSFRRINKTAMYKTELLLMEDKLGEIPQSCMINQESWLRMCMKDI